MRVLVLGAGQDVGKSCVVVRFGGKTFMFDCGMHLGYQDERRFPDFSLLSPTGDFTSIIDAVFITHFHLDHIGALPYFTEVCGYRGPVYMTYPTRAIAPLMLEDYHRVLLDRPGSGPVFAKQHIAACMAKVQLLDLQETVQVCAGCDVTAYSAGHVLGAAILHVRVGSESIVYTGDFNTVPDRHLPGACVPKLRPDLLISESTYATSVRESKVARESSLLAAIQEAVTNGGKVLVPVFAVGRAQELLLLMDEFWERTQLNVPIYFSGPMATRANQYYKLLINWASERVKQGPPGTRANAFGFSRVQPWQPDLMHQQGACVLFATPGMLQGGTSLEVFKAWAPNPKNLVLLPSYQVAGTLGRKLMLGQRKGLVVDKTLMDINCKVYYTSVSAHADAKGILQLVQQVSPSAVLLVHGEPDKMAFMTSKIQSSLGIKCFMPAIGEEVEVGSQTCAAVPTSAQLLRKLPMSLQQLLQPSSSNTNMQGTYTPAAAGSSSSAGMSAVEASAGAAAAGWIQQGDIGQLVHAAMKLAGLNPAGSGTSAVAAVTADKQQQHVPPVSAAARAAQIAPWLELLAAAAQEVQQEATTKQQEQQIQQADEEPQLLQLQQQVPCSVTGGVATLSKQLREQLAFEAHSCVLDGVLVVKHSQPTSTQEQPVVQSMQLLGPETAAESLGLAQHTVRLKCRVQLPAESWQPQFLQQPHEQLQKHQQTTSSVGAALMYVHDMLQSGLPHSLVQQLQLDSCCVRLKSITWTPDPQQRCMVVSWLVLDDALAQQCISLLSMSTMSGVTLKVTNFE